MDPNTLLSYLEDARAPEAIGWWPLAIGWWAVLVLSVAALGAIIYTIIRYRRASAWRRQALKEFKEVKLQYKQQPGARHLANIIILLRRCVASSKAERSMLSATGKQWRDALESPAHCLNEKDIKALTDGHYHPEAPMLDNESLRRIEQWIKRQKV